MFFSFSRDDYYWFKHFCEEAFKYRKKNGRIGSANDINNKILLNEMIKHKYKKTIEEAVSILEKVGKTTIKEILNNKDFNCFEDLNKKLGDHKLKSQKTEGALSFELSKIIRIIIENNYLVGLQMIPDPHKTPDPTALRGFYENYMLKITKKDNSEDFRYDSGSGANAETRYHEKQEKFPDSYIERIYKYSTKLIDSSYSYTYLEPNNKLPALINEFYDQEMTDNKYYQKDQIDKYVASKTAFYGPWSNSDFTFDLIKTYIDEEKLEAPIKHPKKTGIILALGNLAFVTYLSSQVIISSYPNELNLFSEYFQNLINVF